jgi:hypothetical protein
MSWERTKSAARITFFGALGMVIMLGLYLVGVHLYQDHQNLHVLVNMELQREQQMGIANGPAKAPPAPSAEKH